MQRLAQLVDLDEAETGVGGGFGRVRFLPAARDAREEAQQPGAKLLPARDVGRLLRFVRQERPAIKRERFLDRLPAQRFIGTRVAAAHRHVEVVEQLLERPRVHPDERLVEREAPVAQDQRVVVVASVRRSRCSVAVNDLYA